MTINLVWQLLVVLPMLILVAWYFRYNHKIQIEENEIGIIYKKFSLNPLRRHLSAGKLVALHGEPGYQAYTLAPGTHYSYWRWQYRIERVPLTVIPHGQIGLVVAKDGAAIPTGSLLGQLTDCDAFQDGEAFLHKGGQRGRQLQILNEGIYRINPRLFEVITAESAIQYNMNPQGLKLYTVPEGKIGIVTTLDGAPLPADEIAGFVVTGHKNFQDVQAFLDSGGCRGLQEEYLPSGSYRLNPWFVQVKQISLMRIPPGTVGVVISHVGKDPEHAGVLVEPGYKGIWRTPLYPGRHPVNGEIVDVAIVPTNPIALDWSDKIKAADNYDVDLRPLKLRSKDGFEFEIEVTEVIRIDPIDAPRMIASIGVPKTDEANLFQTTQHSRENQKYASIKSLVTKVLEPTINNYFRNSAQSTSVLEFYDERITRQVDAKDYIDNALQVHGVHAIDTLINKIELPSELRKLRQLRSVAEEERVTLIGQMATWLIRQAEYAQKAANITEVEALNSSDSLTIIRHAAEVARMNVPQVFIGGGSLANSSGPTGFEALLMAKMMGIELGQQQPAVEEQPQFTVKQIDTFIAALGDYVEEGGAQKIRNVLMGAVTDSQDVKMIEASNVGNDRLGTTNDGKDSAGSAITGRRRLDLPDLDDEITNVDTALHGHSITRYTDISCPQRVWKETPRFSVVVRLTVHQPVYSLGTTALSVQENLMLQVQLEAPMFELLNQSIQEFLVVPNADSMPLVFDLRPLNVGFNNITFEFYQNGNPLGTVSTTIEVTSYKVTAGHLPHVSHALQYELNTKPPDMILHIGWNRWTSALQYNLIQDSGASYETFRPVEVDAPTAYANRLYQRITELVDTIDPISKLVLAQQRCIHRNGIDRRMKQLGNNLWRELFPLEFKQLYARERSNWKDRSFLVFSDDPSLPWELVWPYDEEGKWEDEGPWCQTFHLTRWLRKDERGNGNAKPPTKLHINALAVLAPLYSVLPHLPSAQAEHQALTNLILKYSIKDVSPLEPKWDRVIDLLESGGYDWMHVAAHGNFYPQEPDGASALWLQNDEALVPDAIVGAATAGYISKHRPSFFLNACEVGQQGWGLTHIGGWANRLLSSGASSFVGPLWAVNDSSALTFATTFYRCLLDGDTVAVATRHARLAVQQSGDPTWLAYSVYAHPNARVIPFAGPDR